MRKLYFFPSRFTTPTYFKFLLLFLLCSFSSLVNAQTFYRSVSASMMDMKAEVAEQAAPSSILCEGSYQIKDGVLDDIFNMKLVLPAAKIDSLLGNKTYKFEQTRVMVLPILSMVHLVGVLDVDGVKNTTYFQLSFLVNEDESVQFKGTKKFNMGEFGQHFTGKDLQMEIDFVLKNKKNNLASLNNVK